MSPLQDLAVSIKHMGSIDQYVIGFGFIVKANCGYLKAGFNLIKLCRFSRFHILNLITIIIDDN